MMNRFRLGSGDGNGEKGQDSKPLLFELSMCDYRKEVEYAQSAYH